MTLSRLGLLPLSLVLSASLGLDGEPVADAEEGDVEAAVVLAVAAEALLSLVVTNSVTVESAPNVAIKRHKNYVTHWYPD